MVLKYLDHDSKVDFQFVLFKS